MRLHGGNFLRNVANSSRKRSQEQIEEAANRAEKRKVRIERKAKAMASKMLVNALAKEASDRLAKEASSVEEPKNSERVRLPSVSQFIDSLCRKSPHST